jgi:hypothetical protein
MNSVAEGERGIDEAIIYNIEEFIVVSTVSTSTSKFFLQLVL